MKIKNTRSKPITKVIKTVNYSHNINVFGVFANATVATLAAFIDNFKVEMKLRL